ncbi:MAG TPA: hypothetical protein VFV38_14680, partial [Ktedonobacteraceae bacterium]|nr:hypothetical protein [Ktedonobacteraceae bacterium]
MDLSLVGVVWLGIACVCLAEGIRRTRRRMEQTSVQPVPRPGCHHCGQPLGRQDRFCGGCGRRILRRTPE